MVQLVQYTIIYIYTIYIYIYVYIPPQLKVYFWIQPCINGTKPKCQGCELVSKWAPSQLWMTSLGAPLLYCGPVAIPKTRRIDCAHSMDLLPKSESLLETTKKSQTKYSYSGYGISCHRSSKCSWNLGSEDIFFLESEGVSPQSNSWAKKSRAKTLA